ncbi:MAG: glycosyltransferase family 4 protein [Chitinophagaceae bacterium]|nr:glycosyltransferase family 4 protein [Chitinophagaceae bacterium]MCW5904903.1 glycosyltransferase family 4 protein [Chitinophagaceae bacterium]
MNSTKKILITGLFISEKNKHLIYRTAADQLFEIFQQHHIPVLKTSSKLNKITRALDVLGTIFFRQTAYSIAITPYYGTRFAFYIEDFSTRLLKLLGKKIILIAHSGGLPERIKNNPQKYLPILKRADVVICPSGYLQHEFKKYHIESIVIENVIKLSDYTFIKKDIFKPAILWMRTFGDIYNPTMAVKVLAIVKQKYPNATLIMGGRDTGELQNVLQLVKELQLEDSVSFPGYIPTEEKVKYAQQSDIYICTNKVDNAPVSTIEMMALGLPIVSVNSGGIPFMVQDNFNGLLVEYDDAEAMATKIITIIEQPTLGKQLALNGFNTSLHYGDEAVFAKWKNILSQFSYNYIIS